MLVDDPMRHRQAESGALGLRRAERARERSPFQDLPDPAAAVAHLDAAASPPPRVRSRARARRRAPKPRPRSSPGCRARGSRGRRPPAASPPGLRTRPARGTCGDRERTRPRRRAGSRSSAAPERAAWRRPRSSGPGAAACRSGPRRAPAIRSASPPCHGDGRRGCRRRLRACETRDGHAHRGERVLQLVGERARDALPGRDRLAHLEPRALRGQLVAHAVELAHEELQLVGAPRAHRQAVRQVSRARSAPCRPRAAPPVARAAVRSRTPREHRSAAEITSVKTSRRGIRCASERRASSAWTRLSRRRRHLGAQRRIGRGRVRAARRRARAGPRAGPYGRARTRVVRTWLATAQVRSGSRPSVSITASRRRRKRRGVVAAPIAPGTLSLAPGESKRCRRAHRSRARRRRE